MKKKKNALKMKKKKKKKPENDQLTGHLSHLRAFYLFILHPPPPPPTLNPRKKILALSSRTKCMFRWGIRSNIYV